MNDIDQNWHDLRRNISERNRRLAVESRLHKLTMIIMGLMAYSAFGNFVGAVMVLGTSPIDFGVGLFFGMWYSFGVYRVWLKDDTRWWPVAVPACLTIVWLLLVWWATGMFLPIPVLLNVALLVLVPIRARASAALTPVLPSNTFKPNPLRGSA
ncbi:hypothetical protein [Pseudoxanthomonas broegbernensis]|uniref:hypothetical protein n=1 Tax=Pseudoxanthomonas broegbernensis TaxID=83619 RepID=UPI001391C61F|nr:hypothetical protein [Pseudoxanthomonas broegbernensis]MBB6064451.1 hypothetical protein [Pseudoxanthomonas broegbernensis]